MIIKYRPTITMETRSSGIYVTGFGKTLCMFFFPEIHVWCMLDKPCHRANSCSSPRLIAHFTEELQRFICNRTTPPIIEKLWSQMHCYKHAYGISVYYIYTGSQLNGPGRSHLIGWSDPLGEVDMSHIISPFWPVWSDRIWEVEIMCMFVSSDMSSMCS